MNAFERLKEARHAGRPTGAAYVAALFENRLDLCGDRRFGEGRADEQHKARRHSGSHGNLIAPQPFLPLNFGDAPLCLRDPFLMTPHL